MYYWSDFVTLAQEFVTIKILSRSGAVLILRRNKINAGRVADVNTLEILIAPYRTVKLN